MPSMSTINAVDVLHDSSSENIDKSNVGTQIAQATNEPKNDMKVANENDDLLPRRVLHFPSPESYTKLPQQQQQQQQPQQNQQQEEGEKVQESTVPASSKAPDMNKTIDGNSNGDKDSKVKDNDSSDNIDDIDSSKSKIPALTNPSAHHQYPFLPQSSPFYSSMKDAGLSHMMTGFYNTSDEQDMMYLQNQQRSRELRLPSTHFNQTQYGNMMQNYGLGMQYPHLPFDMQQNPFKYQQHAHHLQSLANMSGMYPKFGNDFLNTANSPPTALKTDGQNQSSSTTASSNPKKSPTLPQPSPLEKFRYEHLYPFNYAKEGAAPGSMMMTPGSIHISPTSNVHLAGLNTNGFDDQADPFSQFMVSPAVAISKRGNSKKRSPYDLHEQAFVHDASDSPTVVKNNKSAHYCTPIVTGNGENHLSTRQSNISEQGERNFRPSPISGEAKRHERIDGHNDPYDSHLRHFHRPYPTIRGDHTSPSRLDYDVLPNYYDQLGPPLDNYRGLQQSLDNFQYAPPLPMYSNGNMGFYSPYEDQSRMNFMNNTQSLYGHHMSDYSSHLLNNVAHQKMMKNNEPPYSQLMSSSHKTPIDQPTNKRRRIVTEKNEKSDKKTSSKIPRRKKMYSDYVGVTYNKTHAKYQACITHYRKQHYLGRYKLAVDAARAYDQSAKLLKGDGWKINFPTDEDYEVAKALEIEVLRMEERENPVLTKKKMTKAEKRNARLLKQKIGLRGSMSQDPSFVAEKMLQDRLSAVKKQAADHADQLKQIGIDISKKNRKNTSAISASVSETKDATAMSKSAVTPSPHSNTTGLSKPASITTNEPLMSPPCKESNSPSVEALLAQPQMHSPLETNPLSDVNKMQSSPPQNNVAVVSEKKQKKENEEEHDENTMESESKGKTQEGNLAAASALLMIRL